MLRRCLFTLLAIMLLVTLTGCHHLDASLEVSEDGQTVSGEIVISVAQKYAESLGVGETHEGLPNGVTSEPYSEEGYLGHAFFLKEVKTEDLPLTSPSGLEPSLPIGFAQEDNRLTFLGDFTALLPPAKKLEVAGIPQRGKVPPVKINITVAMPGPIEKASPNVTVENNTVIITQKSLKKQKKFSITSTLNSETMGDSFWDRLPHQDPIDRSGWPLPIIERSPIPTYIFTALILGGLALILFAKLSGPSNKDSKKRTKLKKAKKK